MQEVVQIDTLYDEKLKIHFGYVGIDIYTGKIKYYFFYEENGNFNPLKLHAFKLGNVQNNRLQEHLKHCSCERIKEVVPEEIAYFVKEGIKIHREYNKKKGYPIKNIDNYSKSLFITQNYPTTSYSIRKINAGYVNKTNTIYWPYNKEEWKNLSALEQTKRKNSLFHELGHMKVTSFSIQDNIGSLKTGFATDKFLLQPIPTADDEIFYKIEKPLSQIDTESTERVLEELLNDYDCREALSTFKGNYPPFGKRLNNLCEQKLQKARYEHNINVYYETLEKINIRRKKAKELLEMIYACIYSYSKWDRKTLEEQVEKQIQAYELIKMHKL